MEREAIKEAVREALGEELRSFYVDREVHYLHHEFLKSWIDWTKQCKSVVLKTLVTLFIGGIFGLMALGFWIKQTKG
jgi:hypothetical protein